MGLRQNAAQQVQQHLQALVSLSVRYWRDVEDLLERAGPEGRTAIKAHADWLEVKAMVNDARKLARGLVQDNSTVPINEV